MTSTDYQIETMQREIRDLKHRLTLVESHSHTNRYSEAYVKAETRQAASAARQDFALWILFGIIGVVIILTMVLFNILIFTA